MDDFEQIEIPAGSSLQAAVELMTQQQVLKWSEELIEAIGPEHATTVHVFLDSVTRYVAMLSIPCGEAGMKADQMSMLVGAQALRVITGLSQSLCMSLHSNDEGGHAAPGHGFSVLHLGDAP